MSTKNTNKTISGSSRFDDAFSYPDIYREADHMVSCSSLIYVLAALRDLESNQEAMKKEGKDIPVKLIDHKKLRPEIDPVTGLFINAIPMTGVVKYVTENLEEMKNDKEFYKSKGSSLEWITTLKLPSDDQPNSADPPKPVVQKTSGRVTRSQVTRSWIETTVAREILYIDDAPGDEKEVVYSLSIDREKKRIIVCFRGTVVAKDMFTDIKVTLLPYSLPNVNQKICLHRGFYSYLFDKDLYEEKMGETEDINKYEAIMRQLQLLFKMYPDFKLYVTGHSLGGALSTLFAFCASQDPTIPKPVTNISVASPYIGGQSLRLVFQAAEKSGGIRHLRVSNELDVVPHAPPFDWKFHLYKHVGVNLRLKKEGVLFPLRYAFQYSDGGSWNEWMNALSNNALTNIAWSPSGILKMHLCPEYARRLQFMKSELENLHLNKIYEQYLEALEQNEKKPAGILEWAFYILGVVAFLYGAYYLKVGNHPTIVTNMLFALSGKEL